MKNYLIIEFYTCSCFGPYTSTCFVNFEIRNYSILSLAFVASSFRVTEENLVFETVQSGPYSSFDCFLIALKGTHFYILFDVSFG